MYKIRPQQTNLVCDWQFKKKLANTYSYMYISGSDFLKGDLPMHSRLHAKQVPKGGPGPLGYHISSKFFYVKIITPPCQRARWATYSAIIYFSTAIYNIQFFGQTHLNCIAVSGHLASASATSQFLFIQYLYKAASLNFAGWCIGRCKSYASILR